MLDGNQLRQQILPMLETAGLIVQEQDHSDKRKMLIYPSLLQQIIPAERSSEIKGGVENADKELEEFADTITREKQDDTNSE